jgi:Flp pilus assembly protein TadD
MLPSCSSITQGGAKAQDAAYIYDELIDKYGGSALLLSGLAVAKMHQTQFEEAETLLQEALTKVYYAPDYPVLFSM